MKEREAAEKHEHEMSQYSSANWRRGESESRASLVAVPLVEFHRAVERAGEQSAREIAEAHAGRERRVLVRRHELIP